MSKILVRLSFINIALVVRSVTSTPAYADGAAQIKERQVLMKSIGGKMKAIGGILKGKGDATSIGAHTAKLAALSKKYGAAFRAGFGPDAGKMYSKPYIWTDQVAFNKTVAQLVSSKKNLAKAGLLAI
jgi:cytochrome c556